MNDQSPQSDSKNTANAAHVMTPLTAEQKLAIQQYVKEYLSGYAKLIGISTVLAAAAALMYVLFILPTRLSATAVAAANDATKTQIEDKMNEWESKTNVDRLFQDVADARADLLKRIEDTEAELHQISTSLRQQYEQNHEQVSGQSERLTEVSNGLKQIELLYDQLSNENIKKRLPAAVELLAAVRDEEEAAEIIEKTRTNERHIAGQEEFIRSLREGTARLTKLRCGQILVADGRGRVVAELGVLNGAGLLRLNDAEGNRRLQAAASDDGATIELFNNANKRVADLQVLNGEGDLRMFSKDGIELVSMGGSNDGHGGMWLNNAEGNERLRVFAASDGGSIEIRNSANKRVADLQVLTGRGDLRLHSQDGVELVSLGGSTNGNGGMWLKDAQGAHRFRALVAENGGTMEILNSSNQKVVDLEVANGNGHLRLYSAKGNTVASIGSSQKGNGGVWLRDPNGDTRIQVVAPDIFQLLDTKGKVTGSLKPQ